jgi:hypothetical protein
MAIFNSYVSLPEGMQKQYESKNVQVGATRND